jgi:hypothetical protein
VGGGGGAAGAAAEDDCGCAGVCGAGAGAGEGDGRASAAAMAELAELRAEIRIKEAANHYTHLAIALHRSLPSLLAVARCRRYLPSLVAVATCRRSLLSLFASAPCILSEPPLLLTAPCRHSLPSILPSLLAAAPCQRSVTPLGFSVLLLKPFLPFDARHGFYWRQSNSCPGIAVVCLACYHCRFPFVLIPNAALFFPQRKAHEICSRTHASSSGFRVSNAISAGNCTMRCRKNKHALRSGGGS